MTAFDARCLFCGDPVNPLSRSTWHRVAGWERKAQAPGRRGGSDIALREPVDEYAHDLCVRRAQDGVSPLQETLIQAMADGSVSSEDFQWEPIGPGGDAPFTGEVSDARLVELRAMPYHQYLRTPEWQGRREMLLAFANHRCERCHSRYRKLRRSPPHVRAARPGLLEDLEVLCSDCHRREHDV